MVTLRFVFNQDKLKQAGKTEDEMLAPMRDHAKKYEIAEPVNYPGILFQMFLKYKISPANIMSRQNQIPPGRYLKSTISL